VDALLQVLRLGDDRVGVCARERREEEDARG
jgi:hypothetical protein